MSLCTLKLYTVRFPITSCADLVNIINIMNIGNELYSIISRKHNPDYLLFSELPDMVTVLEIIYQIQFSQSYTCHNYTQYLI